MTNFVVGLTNDNPSTKAPVYQQYHHVQYKKKLPASETALVSFPPSDEKFRYVIVQNTFAHNEAICLAEVDVFLRGRLYMLFMYLHHAKILTPICKKMTVCTFNVKPSWIFLSLDILPVAFNVVFYCSYFLLYFNCSYSRFILRAVIRATL